MADEKRHVELTIRLDPEQAADLECAAQIAGAASPEAFAAQAVLDAARSLVQDPWPVCQRLNDRFDGLLRSLE